jgi:hypothetical protein
MTAVTGEMLPVGTKHVRIYALTAAGLPNATSNTTAYEGVHAEGARAFSVTDPGPRRVSHYGDDHVLDVDSLPPTEGLSAELRTAKVDYPVDAILSGISTATVGEAKERPFGTDKEGEEAQVGVMLYQQALDASSGATKGERRYGVAIFPKALLRRSPRGMGESTEETVYQVTPQVVRQRIWGDTLESATDGYGQAQMFEYMTEDKPHVVAWQQDGTGSTTEFPFPSDKPATATGKVHVVTVDGTVTVPTTTLTTAIQFSATDAPTTSAIIVAFYEYE